MAAASMLIGTGLTVMADASFEKVGSIKNADLIYDTNLLRVEGNDGYAMATLDGGRIGIAALFRGCIYFRGAWV